MKVSRRVTVEALLSVLLVIFFVSVVGAFDAGVPTISSVNPGNSAIVSSTNFPISYTVSDTDDNIASSNFFIKLDGTIIPSDFEYKGHMVYDRYDEWYVVDSYQQATITAQVTGAKDGSHVVEVQAKDDSGNTVTQTWNFTVAVKPVFSNMTPANQTVTSNNKSFAVKVTDNNAVNPESIKAELDGTPVNVGFDNSTGLISYQGTIPDGVHRAKVTAADTAGNTAVQEWTFTVQTKGPDLTFAGSGKTYKTSQVALAVEVKSNVKILDTAAIMKIDKQQVAAEFNYKGHWVSDWDGDWYIIDSYNQGTITFNSPTLADGTHELTVTSKDEVGNESTQAWNFYIGQPPTFSSLEPVNEAVIAGNPVIKAIISDPNGNVDLNKVSLLVDNTQVIPQLTTSNSSVILSYSSSDLSNDAYHNVLITASDIAGNSATTAWRFFACATGEQTGFSRLSPGNGVDVTSSPTISLHFTDLKGEYDKTNISLSIDNSGPVRPNIVGKDSEFFITYTPQTMTDGIHTFSVSAPSITAGGAPLVASWSFNVKIPPVITQTSPTDTVTTVSPVLAAYATDNSGVASAKFTVDGQYINGVIDTRFKRISAQVPSALAQGSHDVSLSVLDTSGNQGRVEWKIIVDTNTGPAFPDMPVATNASCWQCHQKEYNFGHSQPSQCLACHAPKFTTASEFRNCLGCHYGKTYITNRHYWDSTWVWDNLPNRRHAVNDIHLSTTIDCTECHSRILTAEHNRPDSKDKNGNPITCDTCHTDTYLATVSPDEATKVKEAVSKQDTSCNACHEQAGHASLHESGMEVKCTGAGCHNGNLQTEHLNNTTTGGSGFTCNTCHDSYRNEVTRAIRNNQLACSSCHSEAHKLPLTVSTPPDVPLYKDLTFSRPLEAALFAGDQGLPAGFEANYKSGLVVLAKRAELNVTDVWNFYKSELANKGWVLKSSEPGANATYFSAEFAKQGRLLTVRCYNTSFGDNSGPGCLGYRVDIWYN